MCEKLERGCYADGALGHQHVRDNLAYLVRDLGGELSDMLRGAMSDDASEEDAALDLLNEHAPEGMVWTFSDGDLLLVPEDWEGFEG